MYHGPVCCLLSEKTYDATCAFSRGCCEVSGTAVKAVSGGLTHSGKCDFLNIAKRNILLRFKENIINFYFRYFNCWFTLSDSEKHGKTPTGLHTCPRHNCAI